MRHYEFAMKFVRQIADGFSCWMDCVAATIVALLDRFMAPRAVRLVERQDGIFSLQMPGKEQNQAPVSISGELATCAPETAAVLKGSKIDLLMQSDRFFFRSLELPLRAREYLDGIVRAQIDRITPWNVSEAAFGWSEPTEIAPDRISVTIAAASRSQIVPFTQAVGRLGVKSVVVSTNLPDDGAEKRPVKVFEQLAGGAFELHQVRRALVAGFVGVAVLAGLAVVGDAVVGSDLRNQQDAVSRHIAQRRGLLRAGSDAAANSAIAKLERRKNQTPASVIVLEALSSALPDHSYVTELRIEGDKMQIVGITK